MIKNAHVPEIGLSRSAKWPFAGVKPVGSDYSSLFLQSLLSTFELDPKGYLRFPLNGTRFVARLTVTEDNFRY